MSAYYKHKLSFSTKRFLIMQVSSSLKSEETSRYGVISVQIFGYLTQLGLYATVVRSMQNLKLKYTGTRINVVRTVDLGSQNEVSLARLSEIQRQSFPGINQEEIVVVFSPRKQKR